MVAIDPAWVRKSGAVAEQRGGKEGACNFLIAQVMTATRGKANPQLVNGLLRQLLART